MRFQHINVTKLVKSIVIDELSLNISINMIICLKVGKDNILFVLANTKHLPTVKFPNLERDESSSKRKILLKLSIISLQIDPVPGWF